MVRRLGSASWCFVVFNQLFHGALFVAAHVIIFLQIKEYWYLWPPFLLFSAILEFGWWYETRFMLRAFASTRPART